MTPPQKKLLSWYQSHGRHDLLWRNTDNLYHIYLSEIMLQQTQANRVQEKFYPQFLREFPTLKDLASAQEEEILALWSGLGYYRRARNLYKSANICGGVLPHTQKELTSLPGIGRYTASAICSFGLQQSIPVVDTNIARVIKRVFALESPKEREIWKKAEEFLNLASSKEHNLALMDLGSLVCTPKNPQCCICPLETVCQGKTDPQSYTKTVKKTYESLELFYGVWIKNNHIALTQAEGNMYQGMLELPITEPIEENFLAEFKHSYTKYRLKVQLFAMSEYNKEVIWADLSAISSYPISSLVKKALKLCN